MSYLGVAVILVLALIFSFACFGVLAVRLFQEDKLNE